MVSEQEARVRIDTLLGAAGVIEAKKQGATLTGVEAQSARYAQGLPAALPAHRRPLPFLYESTGLETHFTNRLDPEPRARNLFAFHRPETLAEWLAELPQATVLTTGDPPAGAANAPHFAPATFLARARSMPDLVTAWGDFKLWPAQIDRHPQPGSQSRAEQAARADPDLSGVLASLNLALAA